MSWFKKKITLGDSYACNTGIHAGKILIYVDSNKSEHGFLSTPNLENLWVPIDQFDLGINEGIIEYVERVPRKVKRTVKAKFNDNKV
tara:strand:- start:4360 stop:4620 length:261 start_codon:yes stop_codon:yes gene_type:complete